MSVGTTQLEKVPKNMKSLCFWNGWLAYTRFWENFSFQGQAAWIFAWQKGRLFYTTITLMLSCILIVRWVDWDLHARTADRERQFPTMPWVWGINSSICGGCAMQQRYWKLHMKFVHPLAQICQVSMMPYHSPIPLHWCTTATSPGEKNAPQDGHHGKRAEQSIWNTSFSRGQPAKLDSQVPLARCLQIEVVS